MFAKIEKMLYRSGSHLEPEEQRSEEETFATASDLIARLGTIMLEAAQGEHGDLFVSAFWQLKPETFLMSENDGMAYYWSLILL